MFRDKESNGMLFAAGEATFFLFCCAMLRLEQKCPKTYIDCNDSGVAEPLIIFPAPPILIP
jgi:hypothetical protein